MSRRNELIAALGAEAQAQQRANDAIDEAAAALLDVNRTDLRCIDALLQLGSATAGQLASELGLTTGSVTAMVDRLERRGYLRRTRDPADRRRVVVEPEPVVAERAAAIYGPLAEEGARAAARYTIAELELLVGFVRRVRAIQEGHAQRIRDLHTAGEGVQP